MSHSSLAMDVGAEIGRFWLDQNGQGSGSGVYPGTADGMIPIA